MTIGTRLREVPAVGWVAVALLIVVGVIAATGGFRASSGGWTGVETEPGALVPTRFWDITVHEAQVISWGPYIEVAVEMTNKQSRVAYPDEYLIVARVLEPRLAITNPQCVTYNDRPFNPDILVEAVCSFSPAEDQELDLDGITQLDIEVVVFEQVYADSVLEGRNATSDHPMAKIRLTAPVIE